VSSQHDPSPTRSAGAPAHGKVIPVGGRRDGSLGEFLSNLLAGACRLGPADAGAALRHSEGNRIDVLAVHPGLAQAESPPE